MIRKVSEREVISWGVKELDELLGPISRSSLVLISGHPGAGKTTLTSLMIYKNAISKGLKTLYVSLAETKEKYFRFMKGLGLDFKPLELKGLFKFVEVPTLNSEFLIDYFTAGLAKDVSEFRPDIVVIDSITPLLQSFEKEVERRAVLHSGIYKFVSSSDGVTVLIADLPYGESYVRLGGLEFIADAVLVVRLRNEGGLHSRWIQVRKFRGRKLSIHELPFSIVPNKVLAIVPTPSIFSILRKHEGKGIRAEVDSVLKSFLGPIPKGTQILITYPIGSDIPLRITNYLVCNAVKTHSKVLITTASLDPKKLELMMALTVASKLGIDASEAIKLLRKYVSIAVRDILSKPITEVFGEALTQVEKFKPDLVIMPDTRVYYELLRDRLRAVNRLFYMFIIMDRAFGVTAIRFLGIKRGEHPLLAELSDVVIKMDRRGEDGNATYDLEFLKSPYVFDISSERIRRFCRELRGMAPLISHVEKEIRGRRK